MSGTKSLGRDFPVWWNKIPRLAFGNCSWVIHVSSYERAIKFRTINQTREAPKVTGVSHKQVYGIQNPTFRDWQIGPSRFSLLFFIVILEMAALFEPRPMHPDDAFGSRVPTLEETNNEQQSSEPPRKAHEIRTSATFLLEYLCCKDRCLSKMIPQNFLTFERRYKALYFLISTSVLFTPALIETLYSKKGWVYGQITS